MSIDLAWVTNLSRGKVDNSSLAASRHGINSKGLVAKGTSGDAFKNDNHYQTYHQAHQQAVAP